MSTFKHLHNCASCERELWYDVSIVRGDPTVGIAVAFAEEIIGPEKCECGFVFDLGAIGEDAVWAWATQAPEWEPPEER